MPKGRAGVSSPDHDPEYDKESQSESGQTPFGMACHMALAQKNRNIGRSQKNELDERNQAVWGVRVLFCACHSRITRARAPDTGAFSEWVLEQAQIAVTPGHAFGPAGEGHFRMSFALDRALITEGVERLARLLA